MGEEGTLSGHRCCNGITGSCKGHEERITLRIYLVSVMLAKSRTQQIAALTQHAVVALTQLLEQKRRSVDIREEQCDGSRWQLRHAKSSYTSIWGVAMLKFLCPHRA